MEKRWGRFREVGVWGMGLNIVKIILRMNKTQKNKLVHFKHTHKVDDSWERTTKLFSVWALYAYTCIHTHKDQSTIDECLSHASTVLDRNSICHCRESGFNSPAPIWWLTTIYNSSSWGSGAFWPSRAPSTLTHMQVKHSYKNKMSIFVCLSSFKKKFLGTPCMVAIP